MHEARHSEPGDKHHTSCFGFDNMDQSLDQGSGHAWACSMPCGCISTGCTIPNYQATAKYVAYSLLSRLCSRPASSDPEYRPLLPSCLRQSAGQLQCDIDAAAPGLLSPEEGARLEQFPRNMRCIGVRCLWLLSTWWSGIMANLANLTVGGLRST